MDFYSQSLFLRHFSNKEMILKRKLLNLWDRYINLPDITKWKIFSGVVAIFFVTLFIAIYVSIHRLSLSPPLPNTTPVPIETSIHSPDAPFATSTTVSTVSNPLATAISESKTDLRSQKGIRRDEYTYVLLGNDFRSKSADRFENTQQSDAFIIIHVAKGKVTLISIARELLIRDLTDLKVSQLYAQVGFKGVETFVEEVFGLPVDGVIATDMNRFPQIVDVIGGVFLTPNMSVHERCGDNDIFYKVNVEVHMDGEELLCYARGRLYSPNGYFDRQERHFEVLGALWQRMEGWLYEDILNNVSVLVSEFMPLVNTNLSGDDIFFLAVEFIVVFSEFENDFDVNLVSMNRSILELYDRVDLDDPFLYYPTVNLKEWTQDAINGDAFND